MNPQYLWSPPVVQSVAVRGQTARLPINRLFFVGRNYHAHAVEMGKPVDKSVERPFYFTKAPQTLTPSGATVAYPPETTNYHFEMELVLAIGIGGFRRVGHGGTRGGQSLWGLGEIERPFHRFVDRLAHFDRMRMVIAADKKQAIDRQPSSLTANGHRLNSRRGPEVLSGHKL
jgi:hypothetical protein